MRSITVAVIMCLSVSLAGAALLPFESAVAQRPVCVTAGSLTTACCCGEDCACCLSVPAKVPQPQPVATVGSEIQSSPKALNAGTARLPGGALAEVQPPTEPGAPAISHVEPPLYTLTHAFLI